VRYLYTAGLALYLLARLPGFIVAGLAKGKHDLPRRLRESFLGPKFSGPQGVLPPGRGGAIWVHACSMGEVLAARTLICGLRERFPGHPIVLSTVTRTGYDIAQRSLKGCLEGLFYFPFDLPLAVRRAVAAVRPAAVVIVETEIWPNFLLECYRRGVAVAWVNGRISDRAFSRYQLAAPLLSPLLAQAKLLIMRTEEDARRIQRMGAPAERVVVAGNLKYDRDTDSGLGEVARALAELPALAGGSGPLIVAGSTTEPEEAIVLEALRLVRRRPGLEAARLLLAPRHPERFEEVAALVRARGLSLARRSDAAAPPADVVLLDTIGELAAAYALADAVFVGGSFASRGGQSILEPAMHSRAAVVGPHMENFREVLADFKAAGATVQLSAEEPQEAARALAGAWARLLEHPEEAAEMGRRAREVLARNAGATARALDYLAPVIEAAFATHPA